MQLCSSNKAFSIVGYFFCHEYVLLFSTVFASPPKLFIWRWPIKRHKMTHGPMKIIGKKPEEVDTTRSCKPTFGRGDSVAWYEGKTDDYIGII